MTLYFGIGAGVAATRLVLDRLGFVHGGDDSTWTLAQAMTDVLWWPLVVLVLLLQRVTAQTSS